MNVEKVEGLWFWGLDDDSESVKMKIVEVAHSPES